MGTMKEGWIRLCEEQGTEIWPLEKDGDDGLYLTKKTYFSGHREAHTTPVYQVWIDDKREVTMVRDEAYTIWREHMAKIEKALSLRSCPFCGGKGKIYENPQTRLHEIVCENADGTCHARTVAYETREEAATAWNRRVKYIGAANLEKIEEIPQKWEPKPCPFCGSKEGPHFFRYEHIAGRARWGVVCLDCMAAMDKGWCQDGKAALDEWNRRAGDTQSELAEMLD